MLQCIIIAAYLILYIMVKDNSAEYPPLDYSNGRNRTKD